MSEEDKKGKSIKVTGDASHPILNIVLVGRTGNGKSATGNSIIGKKVFQSRHAAAGVTMECQTYRIVTPDDGPILNVIDTPGLFDLSVSAEFISNELVKCLALAEGGINAVLIVLSVRNRISKEEQETLSTLQILFGSKILDYVIIVFSGGDLLEEDGQTLDDYLGDGCPKFLKEVLILCEYRMILYDNRSKDDSKKAQQLSKLLVLIKQVRTQNKGKPYTNDMYNLIKEETERHRKKQEELESKGFSEEQVTAMKKELQLLYDQNLKGMAEMVEKTLKEAAAVHEKAMNELKSENDNLRAKSIKQRSKDCIIL